MPAGRPRKEISRSEFEKLCKLQCTQQEIADWFDCSPDTIERWCLREYNEKFAEVFAKNRGKGKISLRRMQWQLAEKSPAMAIFLGKNHLGQTDKVEQTVNDVSEHKGITIHFSDKKAESDGHNIPDGV
jgi:IS30 family transposase